MRDDQIAFLIEVGAVLGGSAGSSEKAEEILSQATRNAPPRYSSIGLRYAPTRPDSTASGDSAVVGGSTPRLKPSAPKQFWRRWSPVPLDPTDIRDPASTLDIPPPSYPGSASVILDTGGRLLALSVIPDRSSDSLASVHPDWDGILRAAGRDPSKIKPTTPRPRC